MKLQISSSALSVFLGTFWRKRALGKGTSCASEFANLEAGIYVVEIKDEAGRTAIEKVVKN